MCVVVRLGPEERALAAALEGASSVMGGVVPDSIDVAVSQERSVPNGTAALAAKSSTDWAGCSARRATRKRRKPSP